LCFIFQFEGDKLTKVPRGDGSGYNDAFFAIADFQYFTSIQVRL